MHYIAMAIGGIFLAFAFVLRFFRLRREKRQNEVEQAHVDALREDFLRARNAEERVEIDRIIEETRQMTVELRERFHREQLLREWHARGGWTHGAPPPEVWELLPGWNGKRFAGKPRDDN